MADIEKLDNINIDMVVVKIKQELLDYKWKDSMNS